MPNIPTYNPLWASGDDTNIEVPTNTQIEDGIQSGDNAYLEYANWYQNITEDKVNDVISGYWNSSIANSLVFDVLFNDDISLYFGTDNDASIGYSTASVSGKDQLVIGVPATNKTLSICETPDISTTLGVSNTSLPIVRLHSPSNASKFGQLFHNGTDALIDSNVIIRLYSGASARPVVIGQHTTSSEGLVSREDLIVYANTEVHENVYADADFQTKNLYKNETYGSIIHNETNIGTTTSYTVQSGDYYIQSTRTGTSTITIELPGSTTLGRVLVLKAWNNSGAIILDGNGGTIEGDSVFYLPSVPYSYAKIINTATSGNAAWQIIEGS